MYSGGNFSCSIKKILRLKENFVLRYICLIDIDPAFTFSFSKSSVSYNAASPTPTPNLVFMVHQTASHLLSHKPGASAWKISWLLDPMDKLQKHWILQIPLRNSIASFIGTSFNVKCHPFSNYIPPVCNTGLLPKKIKSQTNPSDITMTFSQSWQSSYSMWRVNWTLCVTLVESPFR